MQRAGEVTASATTEFTGQCYELYCLPPLGSLIRAGEPPVYGVVYNGTTVSIEPGRRPIARGHDEESEEALYRNSPQIKKLLRSEFTAIAVGYKEGGKVVQALPPNPPAIHSFVYLCPPDELKEFSRSLGFLDIIVGSHLPVAAEELISACLKQMAAAYEDRHAFLVAAGKEITGLLRGNFNQLRLILGRLEQ